MLDSGQALDALKAVWHRAIINVETRELAAKLSNVDAWTDVPDWPGNDYTVGSEEFAALIGSDNGKGVVWLLLQHRQRLGAKAIAKARVWKDHTLHILYIIEDTCSAGGDGTSAATAKGVIRRGNSDSAVANEARDSGRYFAMAQDCPTDILESCMRISQSSFSEVKQLEDSGWTQIPDDQEEIDEERDEATFNSWLDLNLDLRGNANRRIEYQHLVKTTGPDETVYHPSGAYYKNIFSEGAIAALDNASPWKTGPKRDLQVDGKDRPYPPLKQWSDEVFLVYKDFCEGDLVRMKRLKGVLRHNVVNTQSVLVLLEYMQKSGELENNHAKEWPGALYKLDDDGFSVALGLPGGKGVAYLLATHRESLGWKEIYQIRVFSAFHESAFNILYYIRDHQDNPERRRGIDTSGSVWTKANISDDLLVHYINRSNAGENDMVLQTRAVRSNTGFPVWPRDTIEDDFDKALMKGARLSCELYDSASDVEQSTWTDPKALSDYGWTELDPMNQWEYNDPENDLGPALKEFGVSVEGFDNVKYSYQHDESTKHDDKTYPATGGIYRNVFNGEGGVIIATHNYGPDSEKSRDLSSAQVVSLKQWSDVVFLAWQEKAGNKASHLKYVFRHAIVNDKTKNIVEHILKKRGETLKAWPGTKISMIKKDAQAILGTPNGHGVAYLLPQHKKQLGIKVVDHITLFNACLSATGKSMSLCFWLVDEEDTGAPTELPLGLGDGAKELSTDVSRIRSLSDTTDLAPRRISASIVSRAPGDDERLKVPYESAMKKGHLLVCDIRGTIDNVPQSKWVDVKALEDYGWSLQPDRSLPLSPGLTEVFDQLGLPSKSEANVQRSWLHNRPSTHDGIVYPATTGVYTNIMNAQGGAIVATVNFGPEYQMINKNAAIVPLKQYSDVVFLAWQKHAGNDVKNLKYIFRTGVVNKKTKLVVEYILDARDQSLESWPGLVLDMQEDDAHAILGTPNGLGAAYFLAQHKEQLGQKVISKVAIFQEGYHLLCLCFFINEVEDTAPEDPEDTSAEKVKRSVPNNITTISTSSTATGTPWHVVLERRIGKAVANCWTAMWLV